MLNFGEKKETKTRSDEIQPATLACMHAHRHTRRERWWMILLLDGVLSQKKSSVAWHLLYCWSLFPTGLSTLGIISAGWDGRRVPVVTKATQCCVELQEKRWGDAQKLGEGWVSFQLSCAMFGNRGGAECWPIPIFFNVLVNLVLAEFWREVLRHIVPVSVNSELLFGFDRAHSTLNLHWVCSPGDLNCYVQKKLQHNTVSFTAIDLWFHIAVLPSRLRCLGCLFLSRCSVCELFKTRLIFWLPEGSAGLKL